jgi:hypothetical protein
MAHHGDQSAQTTSRVAGVIAFLKGVGIDVAVDQLFKLFEVGSNLPAR